MITVWRIESKDRLGPYWETEYIFRPDWMHSHNKDDNHPRPSLEFGKTPERTFAYGFTSEKQLRDWFDEKTVSWLKEKGYKLTMYLADEYTMFTGPLQCAFEKSSAKLQDRRDYEEVFKRVDDERENIT